MANTCKKGHRSGAHGLARNTITSRNKARFAKRYAKKLARLKAKRSVLPEVIKIIHRKQNPGSNEMGHERRDLHTIRFNEDKVSIIDGLTIEGSDPEGYSLVKPGSQCGVRFITKAGKRWFLPFKSFSFLINFKGRDNDYRHEEIKHDGSAKGSQQSILDLAGI